VHVLLFSMIGCLGGSGADNNEQVPQGSVDDGGRGEKSRLIGEEYNDCARWNSWSRNSFHVRHARDDTRHESVNTGYEH